MDIKAQLNLDARNLLVSRYGYDVEEAAGLPSDEVTRLRRWHYEQDEANGITWCGWCGKRSHGRCD